MQVHVLIGNLAIGFITLYLFISFIFPIIRIKKSTLEPSILNLSDEKMWTFVALKYWAFILNRTYKIVVTRQAICGIRVEYTLTSPKYGAGVEWQQPEFYVNEMLEKKYQDSDFNLDNYLRIDSANFKILRADIVQINYFAKKWGMGKVPYSGRLVLETKNGNTELILLGKQNALEIKKRLENF
jgi:hypothetical protein